MGQATRTTKLLLDLSERRQGGANSEKRAALHATEEVLNRARAFYIDFFLAHAQKLAERVPYYSEKHLEMRERPISANELLSWAETCTVATREHPEPLEGWNFTERFPAMPFVYRRSVIKDAIGKRRPARPLCADQGLRWAGVALGELPREVQPLLPAASRRRGVGAQEPYP